MKKHIALIGECMVELNGNLFGTMTQTYGGDSLNCAVYLSRLAPDKTVSYVTVMGADRLSQGIVARWQEEGIDTRLVLQDESRQPGIYMIEVDALGERSFNYWRDNSAAKYLMQHSQIELVLDGLRLCDVVYLSGISLAILPKEDRSVLIAYLAELRELGICIVFDSNYRPRLWRDLNEARSSYAQILAITDIALITFDDEVMLWGDLSVDDAFARLHGTGIAKVVIKIGPEGCRYSDIDTRHVRNIPTAPIANIVDTTSAGDSFNAGFLSGYLDDLSIEACCMRGNQLAGVVIQHRGAIIAKELTDAIEFENNKRC